MGRALEERQQQQKINKILMVKLTRYTCCAFLWAPSYIQTCTNMLITYYWCSATMVILCVTPPPPLQSASLFTKLLHNKIYYTLKYQWAPLGKPCTLQFSAIGTHFWCCGGFFTTIELLEGISGLQFPRENMMNIVPYSIMQNSVLTGW